MGDSSTKDQTSLHYEIKPKRDKPKRDKPKRDKTKRSFFRRVTCVVGTGSHPLVEMTTGAMTLGDQSTVRAKSRPNPILL